MEQVQVNDEQVHKKGRHRKKQLFNSILQQMEFYFSDSNLSKDKFLLPLVEKDPFVDLSTFLKFNKIRKLTNNLGDIVKALNKSEFLELSEDNTKVRRKTPMKMKDDVIDCTIYVERIKADATHEWVSTIFSEFGNVVYVSIPKYRHNKMNKGFAFVEFDNKNEAMLALKHFESIGCKMSSQVAPEQLCSIATFSIENDKSMDDEADGKVKMESSDEKSQRKRKNSTEDGGESKKIKIETEENSNSNIESEDVEEKKKKKSKKAKKTNFAELGLLVLSMSEWKKLRNKYLNAQRTEMAQLKQYLRKKAFSNDREIPENIEDEKKKTDFNPGLIVLAKLSEPCYDVKPVKVDLKSMSSDIAFIEIPHLNGCEEAYIRFATNDGAKSFCTAYNNEERFARILEGNEEADYWERIKKCMNEKLEKQKNKKTKTRGREKLLKKAENVLGKHIKFDDND